MASRAASTIRRALLYVPSSSQKMLTKSLGLNVDCVAYDLEDSVSLNMKSTARSNLRSFLSEPNPPSIRERAVRINAIGTGLEEDDLAEICRASSVDTIVIPKVNSPSDLKFVTDYLAHHHPNKSRPPALLALIESAISLQNLAQICRTTSSLQGLIFAAEDFAHDLSLTRTPSLTEFLYARSSIVTAARANEVPSTIDLVCTEFKGDKGLQRLGEECEGGKGLGFNGKQCIHPSQVEVVQNVFAPGKEEVEWAVRVVIADKKAGEGDQGRGAWALDGKMIDVPVVKKAGAIVTRAEACGFDVEALKEEWRSQEPE